MIYVQIAFVNLRYQKKKDDYRSIARRVSKREEDLNQTVKFIDLRLEKEILGRVEAQYEPADEEIDEIESFRYDSFNKRVDYICVTFCLFVLFSFDVFFLGFVCFLILFSLLN